VVLPLLLLLLLVIELIRRLDPEEEEEEPPSNPSSPPEDMIDILFTDFFVEDMINFSCFMPTDEFSKLNFQFNNQSLFTRL
jgi:hypothetical protein